MKSIHQLKLFFRFSLIQFYREIFELLKKKCNELEVGVYVCETLPNHPDADGVYIRTIDINAEENIPDIFEPLKKLSYSEQLNVIKHFITNFKDEHIYYYSKTPFIMLKKPNNDSQFCWRVWVLAHEMGHHYQALEKSKSTEKDADTRGYYILKSVLPWYIRYNPIFAFDFSVMKTVMCE